MGQVAQTYGRMKPVHKERLVAEKHICFGPGIEVIETPGHAAHHLTRLYNIQMDLVLKLKRDNSALVIKLQIQSSLFDLQGILGLQFQYQWFCDPKFFKLQRICDSGHT